MRIMHDQEKKDKVADFLELMAESVRHGRRPAYRYTMTIHTPADEVATMELDIEVTADEDVVKEANELL